MQTHQHVVTRAGLCKARNCRRVKVRGGRLAVASPGQLAEALVAVL